MYFKNVIFFYTYTHIHMEITQNSKLGLQNSGKTIDILLTWRLPALELRGQRLPTLPESRTIFYYGTCAARKQNLLIEIHRKSLPNVEDAASWSFCEKGSPRRKRKCRETAISNSYIIAAASPSPPAKRADADRNI